MEIANTVAVVTGGGSGLGEATAQRLYLMGASVVVLDLPGSPGAGVAAELGDRARFAEGDVTSEADVAAALDVAESLGPVRIIVNCAGVGSAARVIGKEGPFPLDKFSRVVTINLIGSFNVVRLGAQRMAKAGEIEGERGVVINTASAAAFEGQIGQAAYSASKGGVAAMTLPIARELAGLKIRVATIAPGLFDTPMLRRIPEEQRAKLGAQVPHPSRLGLPAEYAQLVTAIVTNPMLNGETIRLDGAIRMSPR